MQLFRNVYIFYDASIESSFKNGETILTHVQKLVSNMFPAIRQPKLIQQFIQAVSNIKTIVGTRKNDFLIDDNDVIRHFASEFLIGSI